MSQGYNNTEERKFQFAKDYWQANTQSQRNYLGWLISINGGLWAALYAISKSSDYSVEFWGGLTMLALILVNLIISLHYTRQHYLNELLFDKILSKYKSIEENEDKWKGWGWILTRLVLSLMGAISIIYGVNFFCKDSLNVCVYVLGVFIVVIVWYFALTLLGKANKPMDPDKK
ncbi:MAG: hypothetical protein HYW47_01765 [Deltaproteobacteria bacterium]|nr:hypothetical protein [Deltaproteobacteria bacterium]